MDIADAFRKAYFASLKSVSGFKVLVIDSQTEETLSQIIPNSVNTSLGVSATMRIEFLNNVSGDSMPWTNCVIIASSTDENIQSICNELRQQHFGDLYIYLTTRPGKDHLESLAREDKSERIRNLRILFTFFHVEYPDLFYTINMTTYNAVKEMDTSIIGQKEAKLNRVIKHVDISASESLYYEAESLLSVLRAIGRTPFCVRHTNTPSTIEFLRQLDKSVGNEGRWSGFKFDAKGLPPVGSVEKSMAPFELIIMDRRDDVIASMLTDYTFTGILREYGGLRDGVAHIEIKGRTEEEQLAFNPLIDPNGTISEIGAAPFIGVVDIINRKLLEYKDMVNQIKERSLKSANEDGKNVNAVTAVQDALIKQDQIFRERTLLKDLGMIVNRPIECQRAEKWAQWYLITFKLAIYSSKKKLKNDKSKIDSATKKAIKLFEQSMSNDEINKIPNAMIRIVFVFIAGFPEIVLKPTSKGIPLNAPHTLVNADNSNNRSQFSPSIRNSCINVVKTFYCSKSLATLSDIEAEGIIDRFANYSLKDYKGVDWYSIAQHPLNRPSKVAKVINEEQVVENDGMFSLDFLAKENKNTQNAVDTKALKASDEKVPKCMFQYIPLSVSLSTLAVRNEHKDLLPIFDHLTDKRVLEAVNAKTKVIHDVLVYIIGGVSSYEHIIPSPIGKEKNPTAFADRERLASLLSGHCILGGTDILTPKKLISEVVGKKVE